MAGADGTSPGAAAERLQARAARVRDLTPVLRVQAETWQAATMDAFRDETSPAGDPWPALAPSTIERRIAKLPGANRRSKKTGQLTKGARDKRDKARGSANAVRMLVDTGRLRKSIAYRASKNTVEVSIAAYGQPHVTGDTKSVLSQRPPKRNPLVIERYGDGSLRLAPKFAQAFGAALINFINTGKVA